MKVYKYRGVTNLIERDLPCLIKNQIYASFFSELNDPFEASYNEEITAFLKLIANVFNADTSEIEKSINNILNFKDKVGVYSLTKTFNHELLWAYYADGYKGFCLEYDVEILKENYQNVVQQIIVDYKEKVPVLNDEDLKNKFSSIYQKIFGTKSKSWEHEKEVRLVYDTFGLKEYHPSALTGIYFGERMDNKYKELLISSLINRDVKFHQLKKQKGAYNLDAEFIHENKRNAFNRLDKESFEILKTDHNPIVQNYYLLHKNPPENKDELIKFTNKFKEEYCRKKCNVSIFNSDKVLPIIDKYHYNKEENELYEKHLIHFTDFTE
jgi:hypothetical protein